MSTSLQFFEVGGAVRDSILGIPSKDVDFSVVGSTGFEAMVSELEAMGFTVLTTKLETLTAVCRVPASMPELLARTKIADFVMARKESSEADGRMPDVIEPGDLLSDLSRRDFTVNAMARDPKTGDLIDFFGGVADLDSMTLRFVGDPMLRITEDPLRVARAFRFMVTKGFRPCPMTGEALASPLAAELVRAKRESTTGKLAVSVERLQVEMDKMFMFDTQASLTLMAGLPLHTREALFPAGLRLSATMKQS